VLGESFPQILAAARGSAEWAWTRIYGDLAPPLLGYLRTRSAVDAEDLMGEVFLQVVRDLNTFEGGERDFRAWVFTIAHHRLLDDARSRARRPLTSTEEAIANFSGGNVEEEALESIATQRVREMITRLPLAQRDVLLLRVLGGLTVDQVASAMGKSSGAVKALQRRGLAAIARALAKEGVTL
jgi:RNA polymerase sigma-70 factor (ECF subfamily)